MAVNVIPRILKINFKHLKVAKDSKNRSAQVMNFTQFGKSSSGTKVKFLSE